MPNRLKHLTFAVFNDTKRGIDVIPADKPARQTSKQANFAHPYYWASFILIGNGL